MPTCHQQQCFLSPAQLLWRYDMVLWGNNKEELLDKGRKLYAYIHPTGASVLRLCLLRKIKGAIEENLQESRREWMLWMMERAGRKNSNNNNFQFWQQHNKPIELLNK